MLLLAKWILPHTTLLAKLWINPELPKVQEQVQEHFIQLADIFSLEQHSIRNYKLGGTLN